MNKTLVEATKLVEGATYEYPGYLSVEVAGLVVAVGEEKDGFYVSITTDDGEEFDIDDYIIPVLNLDSNPEVVSRWVKAVAEQAKSIADLIAAKEDHAESRGHYSEY